MASQPGSRRLAHPIYQGHTGSHLYPTAPSCPGEGLLLPAGPPLPPSTSFHSQVKAEVLLLLEEVIHNELAHEVGVQRVVDDLGASEL